MSSSENEFFDCIDNSTGVRIGIGIENGTSIKTPPPLPNRSPFITIANDSKKNLAEVIEICPPSHPDSQSEFSDNEGGPNHSVLYSNTSLSSLRPNSINNKLCGRRVRVRSINKEKMEFSSLHLIQELKCNTDVVESESDLTDFDEFESTSSISSSRNHNQQHQTPLSTSPIGKSSKGPSLFISKFSNDGTFLAIAGEGGKIWIWKLIVEENFKTASTSSLSLRKDSTIFSSTPYQIFEGHDGDVVDISWSKNDFLLSSSIDQTVRLWHHSRTDCLGIFTHPDIVTSISFHPRDDRIFMSGCMDCRVRLWSITDRAVKHWNELPSSNFITAVSFSHSGKWALAGTSTGVCLMFESEQFNYQTQIHVQSTRGKNRFGHKICGIEPMPGKLGDELILISTNDSRIRLYTLKDKSIICKFYGHLNQSSQIKASFSDDGEYCISGSEDGRICVWSVENRFGKRGFWRRLGDSFGRKRSSKTVSSNGNSSESINSNSSNTFFNTGAKLRAIINRKFKGEYVKGVEYWTTHSRPVMSVIFAPSCVKMKLQAFGLRPILGSRTDEYSEGQIIVAVDLKGRIRVYENNSLLSDWMSD